jgi:hypothetical protein
MSALPRPQLHLITKRWKPDVSTRALYSETPGAHSSPPLSPAEVPNMTAPGALDHVSVRR